MKIPLLQIKKATTLNSFLGLNTKRNYQWRPKVFSVKNNFQHPSSTLIECHALAWALPTYNFWMKESLRVTLRKCASGSRTTFHPPPTCWIIKWPMLYSGGPHSPQHASLATSAKKLKSCYTKMAHCLNCARKVISSRSIRRIPQRTAPESARSQARRFLSNRWHTKTIQAITLICKRS